jgi:hypothetical protein
MSDKLATLEDYQELMEDRPRKFSPEEVAYEEAPKGSAIICAACIMYYRRAIDGLATCEIMRSEETDTEGVHPNWRCRFQSLDGDQFPLLEND